LVVGSQMQLERRVQFRRGGKAGLRHELADAPVEALDHAVGLRVTGRAQPMFNGVGVALDIKGVAPRSLLAGRGKAVGELAAAVRQNGLDHHRCHSPQAAHKVGAAGLGLVAVGAKVHPACGPVDGAEELTPAGLIGHLRQVFDVNVHDAGLVVVEGLLGLDLAFHHRHQTCERGHAVAHQTAVQTRARYSRIDELLRDRQQVIKRQQQHASQLDHQHLLARRESCLQGVRPA
jgi:hypothetical protein